VYGTEKSVPFQNDAAQSSVSGTCKALVDFALVAASAAAESRALITKQGFSGV